MNNTKRSPETVPAGRLTVTLPESFPKPVAVLRIDSAPPELLPPPQTLAVPPPPQVWGDVHEPQVNMPPQLSEICPQLAPCAAHVVGVQVPMPQTLAVPPPPQVCPPLHEPQLRV